MRNSYVILLFLSLVLTKAQKPDQIIQKHLERSGGKANWNQLNSIILKGETIIGVGDSYHLIIYHRRPYFKRVAFIENGKEVLNEGYDGKKAWTYDPSIKKNVTLNNYSPDSFENDLMNYKKKGMTATLVGKENWENQTCYVIALSKNITTTKYCFSTENYALLWEETPQETLYYYNYTSIKGLQFAKKIIGKPKQGGEYSVYFDEILVNPVIDNKKFKF